MREAPAPGSVPRLEVPGWRAAHGLVAGLTVPGPEGAPDGFDLGLRTERPVRGVMERWDAFRSAEPGFGAWVLGQQVHRAEVRWHEGREGWVILPGVDGHATADAGTMLLVTVADCVPVFVADPSRRAVALLHAGWRGASAGVLGRGLALLSGRVGSTPGDLMVHLGPAICGACYEVGAEVVEAFGGTAEGTGPWHEDIRGRLRAQAEALGVRPDAISTSAWCTAHDRPRFHSHRASGGRDGRMVAYLGMPVG